MPLLDLMTAGASSDVAETSSILRFARVMRILRTARIAKLIRYMPELVILLKGMMSACRSVFFTPPPAIGDLRLLHYDYRGESWNQLGRGSVAWCQTCFFHDMHEHS